MDIHSSYYRNYPLNNTSGTKSSRVKMHVTRTGITEKKLARYIRNSKVTQLLSAYFYFFSTGKFQKALQRTVIVSIAFIWFGMMLPGCGQEDPDISAPSGMGSLFVTSTPDSASIQIDEVCTGSVTPATLNNISVGSHTVRVSKTGYIADPESAQVEIIEGQTSSVEFTLSLLQSRPVILESFTNVCCTPCADANPMMYELMNRLGHDRAVLLEFHTQFPSPLDPFYLEQKTLMDSRIGLYGVSQAPWVVIEGTEGLQPSSEGALQQVIDDVNIGTEVDLRVTGEASGTSVTCTLSVESLTSGGTYILHVFVTDSFIEFEDPPGTNGETEFRHVVRGVLPSADGETVVLSTDVADTFVWNTDLSWWSGEDEIRLTAIATKSGSLELVGAGLYDLP